MSLGALLGGSGIKDGRGQVPGIDDHGPGLFHKGRTGEGAADGEGACIC